MSDVSSTGRVGIVGEAIVAFMRSGDSASEPYSGPFPSGAPAIFASALARLGCPVTLYTSVGNDHFGHLMVERLAAHGVDTSRVVVDATHPTSAAFVEYHEDGSRDFIYYLSETAGVTYPPESVADGFEQIDWLHISGSAIAFGGSLASSSELAIALAFERGVPISLDPNIRREAFTPAIVTRINAVMAKAQVVFASEGELEALGASSSELVAAGRIVCHKKGSRGAVVQSGTDSWTVLAPAVVEVDPDGAGDIFAAGFLAGLLAGKSPAEAAAIGCRVAANSVTVRGPMESLIERLPEYHVSLTAGSNG